MIALTTFSNGHRHQYTGKRAVTAAWMVITPVMPGDAGKVLSGHSINAQVAEMTARAAAAECSRFHVAAFIEKCHIEIVSVVAD